MLHSLLLLNPGVRVVLFLLHKAKAGGNKNTEWLFIRARTNRILAICTVYDHVTIQVALRDKLR